MQARLPPDGFERFQDRRQGEAALTAKSPAGVSWINPDDIAPAMVFLASDAAWLVSRASLAVTGGDSANLTA
jgi:NAD(P)-dependent dehydrogenase (short-subunit alcohol dehydrogenase family)